MKNLPKYVLVFVVFALALCGAARGIGLNVVSYYVSRTGTVAYEYRGAALPQKLAPDEDVALRTASSFTERVGAAPDGRPVYRLTSYTSPHFIAENGMWYERRAATTTETAFFLAHPDRAVASALSAAVAYAASFSGFASSGDGYSAVTNTGDIDFPVAGIDDCQGNSGNSLDASNYTNTTGIVSVTLTTGGSGSCIIRRAFLPFDTSSITAGSTVTAATMSLYATAKTNNLTTGDDLYLVQAPSDGYFPNFGVAAGATNINMGSITTSAYNTWTLNSTGFAWITAAGTTYLGVREQHDISDFMTAGTNSVTFSTSENTGTSQDPTLSVTYTPPSAPTISSSAATGITATSAVLNGSMSANGGIDPTTCGFAWGTDATLSGGNTATTTDSTCPTGSGSFSKTVTTSAGMTYYFRAYATNTGGTGYGSILNFTSSRKALAKPPNNLGLVGYWPMNEATSTKVGDFSGNGNTGTLSGATLPSWTTGKRGGALTFGAANNQVTLTGPALTTTHTIAMWVYPTAGPSGCTSSICALFALAGTQGLVYTTGNVIQYLGGGGGTDVSSSAIPLNAWTYVVVSVNAGSSTLYINGASAGSGTNVTAYTPNRLGGDTSNTQPFPGKVDDVRVYSRALSATEIAALYGNGSGSAAVGGNASSKTLANGTTLGSGLVGLWTFDGGALKWTSATAGVAYDLSGNTNTGTLTNMTQSGSVAVGKLGQALGFDGSTQCIDAGNGTSLRLTGSMTLSSWVKITGSIADDGNIISKSARFGAPNLGYSLAITHDNGPQQFYVHVSSDGTAEIQRYSNTTLVSNQWYHLVGVYDASAQTMHVYVNGVLDDGTLFGTVPASQHDSGSNVSIGTREVANQASNFNGIIDDARIYNRALSASEVAQLYKLGKVLVKP